MCLCMQEVVRNKTGDEMRALQAGPEDADRCRAGQHAQLISAFIVIAGEIH